MNELEVEQALERIADAASSDAAFLRAFPVMLMQAYQAPASQIARAERDNEARLVKANGSLFGHPDFIWSKSMHYRAANPGQVSATLEELKEQLKPKAIPGKNAPRFLLSTDGAAFAAVDLKRGEDFVGATLADIAPRYDFLQRMFGVERREVPVEHPADVKAAKVMRELHDALVANDPIWKEEDYAEALNTFMVRLLFCLFADSAGVLPVTSAGNKPFRHVLALHGAALDGSNTREALLTAFATLNMRAKDEAREGLQPRYRNLPYVNGDLFSRELPIPAFDDCAQRALKNALDIDWAGAGEDQGVNADIFGSMIQGIAGKGDRSHYGMHYTSVPNIMKVLKPLFLDELRQELAEAVAQRSSRRLEQLLARLSLMHVFDPACGSGNFLIIAYRELRAIETAALHAIHGGQRALDVASGIRLDHFHGIDPVDFACRTARLSLWISQIQEDRKLAAIGMTPPPILPLHDAGDIRQGSALDIDWSDVVGIGGNGVEIPEIYIVGNPPYLGSNYQSDEQKADMDRIFADKLRTWRNLDFVAAWFALATEHVAAHGSQAAFVSTNSICQGEQVPTLWPWILSKGVEIGFAHTSFKWSNSAARNAGVACVIVGLRPKVVGGANNLKAIYSEGEGKEGEKASIRRVVRNVNPYLIAGENVIVQKTSQPLNGLPEMIRGNQPTDGGNLLLDRAARDTLLKAHPEAVHLLKPIMGSREFIRGEERWCLWIEDADLEYAMSIGEIARRIGEVQKARLKSPDPQANEMATRPHQFREMNYATSTLIMPVVSSEKRQYLQCDILQGVAVSNLAFAILDAKAWILAICSTRMMHQWTSTIGSKLEDRTRFSNTMVYNTFPVPSLDDERRARLNELGLGIMDARQPYLDDGRTIAWLYDTKTMPADLKAAHDDLDAEFEAMYIRRSFRDDAERLAHLFGLYARMSKP